MNIKNTLRIFLLQSEQIQLNIVIVHEDKKPFELVIQRFNVGVKRLNICFTVFLLLAMVF